MASSSKPLPYTANPLLLMANDLMLFAAITFTWPITAGLPSIVLPLWPTRSGPLDELYLDFSNVWAMILHGILVVAQLVFLISLVVLPFIPSFPVSYIVYVIAFIVINARFTVLLNGWRREAGFFRSNPKYLEGNWPKYENERWVFINGVAVG